MNRGLLLIVAACALIACGNSADPAGQTLAGIRQRGEITWGADIQAGEPYVYEDPENPSQLIGFEVDIMNGVARRLGVKARMVQYTWSNLVPSLEPGTFDIAMNGLEVTKAPSGASCSRDPYYIFQILWRSRSRTVGVR